MRAGYFAESGQGGNPKIAGLLLGGECRLLVREPGARRRARTHLVRRDEIFLFGQSVALLLVTSWAKAGLLPWWNWFLLGGVSFGFCGVLLLRAEGGRALKLPWKPALPVFVFLGLTGWSLLHPAYNPPASLRYNQQEFEEAALRERWKPLAVFVDKELVDVRAQAGVDPGLALSLFHQFRGRYLELRRESQRSLGQYESPFDEFVNRFAAQLEKETPAWAPRSLVGGDYTWRRGFPIGLLILQGILLWQYLSSRRLIRGLLLVAALNGALLAVAGTLQKLSYEAGDRVLEIWGLWNAPEPRYYFASFTYKNHWAAFALSGTCAGIGLIWDECRGKGTWAWKEPVATGCLAAVVLVAVSVPLSGSRSGVCLLILLLLMVAVALAWTWAARSPSFGKRALRFAAGIGVCLVVMGGLVGFGAGLHRETRSEAVNNTLQQWEALKEGKPPLRYYLWKDTWSMFLDRPVFGHGLGSLRALYPLYQSSEYRKERERGLEYAHRELKPQTDHSHSDWLQYLAETGLVGVVLLAATPLAALRGRGKRMGTVIGNWTMAGALLFGLYALVDFPTRTPATLLLFVMVFALGRKHAALEERRAGVSRT